MPGETGVTVVTMLVCFVLFRTRGCGCIERPAFPAPSVFSGRMILQNSGTLRREIAESYLDLTSLRGAKRRSNPLFLCGPMDCFACARNDVSTRATLSIVIVREGGRSSIPEKSVIEPRGRGVLDTRWSLSSGSPKARPGGGYDGYCSRRCPVPLSCPPSAGSTARKSPPGGGGQA